MFITLKKEWQGQQPGTTIDIPEAAVAQALVGEGIGAELSGDPYGGIIAKALDASVSNLTKTSMRSSARRSSNSPTPNRGRASTARR